LPPVSDKAKMRIFTGRKDVAAVKKRARPLIRKPSYRPEKMNRMTKEMRYVIMFIATFGSAIYYFSYKTEKQFSRIETVLMGESFLQMPIDGSLPHRWINIAWRHISLNDGEARAKRDLDRREVKYYLHGLASIKYLAQEKRYLAEKGIDLVLSGCGIGTPEYIQNMRYNKFIQSETSLSIEYILRGASRKFYSSHPKNLE
jgi:hypothetical protein